MSSLTKVKGIPQDFVGVVKAKSWLEKLNELRAIDEINEEDVRQLIHDLESSYSAFHRFLSANR
jgi:ESCRT-I complex subunit VPS28